jgi:hypothetical protein
MSSRRAEDVGERKEEVVDQSGGECHGGKLNDDVVQAGKGCGVWRVGADRELREAHELYTYWLDLRHQLQRHVHDKDAAHLLKGLCPDHCVSGWRSKTDIIGRAGLHGSSGFHVIRYHSVCRLITCHYSLAGVGEYILLFMAKRIKEG